MKIVVGISGASGFIYGYTAVSMLKEHNIETHLVITNAAQKTRQLETGVSLKEVEKIADFTYSEEDICACIASGSFKTNGMLVAPCSVNTLSSIAGGITSNLLTRAADVTLKERRRLVLAFRETPLHSGHIRNMQLVTEMGGIIFPPVPAFYHNPRSVNDIVYSSVARMLDLLGVSVKNFKRWGE